MSPTNRTATSTGHERPTVRTSSRSGLADSALGTRNLMMIAALAVVSMILLVPLNYLAPAAGASPDAVLLGCAIMGLWLVPYLLPATVVRRPGAVMIAALLMGIMSVFTTPTGPAAIVGNLIGGAPVGGPLGLLPFPHAPWLQDTIEPSGQPVLVDELRQPAHLETVIDPPADRSRLRDLQKAGPQPHHIPHEDILLAQAGRGHILAQTARNKRLPQGRKGIGQPCVVLDRILMQGPIRPPVIAPVHLHIPGHALQTHIDGANARLEDARQIPVLPQRLSFPDEQRIGRRGACSVRFHQSPHNLLHGSPIITGLAGTSDYLESRLKPAISRLNLVRSAF